MNYATFLSEKLSHRCKTRADLFTRVIQHRGLLADDVRGLHPGSTRDDLRLFEELKQSFAPADHREASALAALTANPQGDRREAMVSAYRRKPPFFRVRYSPARPDARLLDPGVAMLVKALPLAGVWTWCSCDGHHGLGREPRRQTEAARIWLADVWYEKWCLALLSFLRNRIDLHCEWQVIDGAITVDGSAFGSAYAKAYAQDSDMIAAATFLLNSAVNGSIQAIKSRCHRSRGDVERARHFEEACQILARSA